MDDRKKLGEFYPVKWAKRFRYNAFVAVTIFSKFSILALYLMLTSSNEDQVYFFAFSILLLTFLSTMYLNRSFILPMILYNNGITPHEPKMRVFFTKKRKFISFDDITEIRFTQEFRDSTLFIIQEGKDRLTYSIVDSNDEFVTILNTFQEYKKS